MHEILDPDFVIRMLATLFSFVSFVYVNERQCVS